MCNTLKVCKYHIRVCECLIRICGKKKRFLLLYKVFVVIIFCGANKCYYYLKNLKINQKLVVVVVCLKKGFYFYQPFWLNESQTLYKLAMCATNPMQLICTTPSWSCGPQFSYNCDLYNTKLVMYKATVFCMMWH